MHRIHQLHSKLMWWEAAGMEDGLVDQGTSVSSYNRFLMELTPASRVTQQDSAVENCTTILCRYFDWKIKYMIWELNKHNWEKCKATYVQQSLVSEGHQCNLPGLFSEIDNLRTVNRIELQLMWHHDVTSHGDRCLQTWKKMSYRNSVFADTSNFWLAVYFYFCMICYLVEHFPLLPRNKIVSMCRHLYILYRTLPQLKMKYPLIPLQIPPY